MGSKIAFLVIGLLSGVIIGASVGWKIFGGGKSVYVYNNTSKFEQTKEKNVKPSQEISDKKNKFAENKKEDLQIENLAENKPIGIEKKTVNLIDTVQKSILLTNDEEIVVKKDELIVVKNLSLIDLNPQVENHQISKDTLIAQISGIKEPVISIFYIIEFWKSPINYKGYKTNKNKIVLFGIPESDKTKLFKLGDEMYLKNNEKVYHIKRTNDFASFEIITDSMLLSKFIQ